MKTIIGRGHSFPFPGDGSGTLQAEPEATYGGLGFRVVWARSWVQELSPVLWTAACTDPHVRSEVYFADFPASHRATHGFRLAWSVE